MQILRVIAILSVLLVSAVLANAGPTSMPFSSLPIEAQANISAELARSAPGVSWVKLAKLTASDGLKSYQPDLGGSVSISGNTIAVGAPGAQIGNNAGQGAVYVFVKPKNGWKNMTQVAKLTASDGGYENVFGASVAIFGDTIVAGAPGATVGSNPLQGVAYVFVRPVAGWKDMTETAKLISSDGGQDDLFGGSVSINGNTAAIGAMRNAGQGAAYTFVEPAGGWTNMTQTAKLTPSDPIMDGEFGNAVQIESNTVVVGEHYKNRAYVFVKPAAGWENMNQTAELTPRHEEVFDQFGYSVAVSGRTVLIGDLSTNPTGGAYVYVEPAGGWRNMTQTAKLSAGRSNYLGLSVFTNGEMALVGAADTTGVGSAYVYIQPRSGWKSTSKFNQKLLARDKAAHYFGQSLFLSGETAVIGAPGTSLGKNTSQGAAYVFGQQ
jgi:hypothetical protein